MKFNMLKIIVTITILFLIFSCVSLPKSQSIKDSDLLINDTFTLHSPDKITKDALERDIAILIYTLKNGYGGRKYIDQKAFSKAIFDISKLQEISTANIEVREVCEKIANTLLDLPDNHLAVNMDGKECKKDHEEFYGEGNVGKNISKNRKRPWDLNYKIVLKMKIPIISITGMPFHEDKVWDGFLDTILAEKASSPAIIVDLRGNGGGDDTMGLKMASFLYGQDFPTPVESIIISQTPATFALAANQIQFKILRLKSLKEQIPRYLEERLKKQMDNYYKAISGQLAQEKVKNGDVGYPFDAKKAFTKPIYLLIDRGCSSSCESTVESFEAHPFATTIGENTGGFIHFGNMGQLVLPESQIIIQMATDYWKRRDGKFFEKIGYSPKIKINKGDDALVAALSELEKYFKNKK